VDLIIGTGWLAMVRKAACGLALLGLVPQASAFVAPTAPGQKTALRGVGQAQAAPAPSPSLAPGLVAAATLGFGVAVSQRTRKTNRASIVSLKAAVGDAIPNVGLDLGFPPEKVMLGEFCKGKKVVLVGLPGAFTPT